MESLYYQLNSPAEQGPGSEQGLGAAQAKATATVMGVTEEEEDGENRHVCRTQLLA